MVVVKFEETEFSKGIMLETNSEKFKSVFDSEEELFEYIDIYSIQATFEKKAVIGEQKFSNRKRLEMGCPT